MMYFDPDAIGRAISSIRPMLCFALAFAAACVEPRPLHAHSNSIGAIDEMNAEYASMAALATIEVRTNRVAAGRQVAWAFRRAERERDIYSGCESSEAECHPNVRRWRNSLERLRLLEGLELVGTLNATLNALIRYEKDHVAYGEEDYWATPVESLTGYGDCEDYAMLKYLSLRELGYSAQQLRIRIVLDRERNVGHAVLTVDLHGQTYVLDSLSPKPKLYSTVSRYIPVYSVNERGQWLSLAVRSRSALMAMQPGQ